MRMSRESSIDSYTREQNRDTEYKVISNVHNSILDKVIFQKDLQIFFKKRITTFFCLLEEP